MNQSNKAREHARLLAQSALELLNIPTVPAKALAGVMHLGESVIDLVAAQYRERACNPRPWALFHLAMASRLPRIRWIARLHHRRMARRYSAMHRAGTYIGCTASQ